MADFHSEVKFLMMNVTGNALLKIQQNVNYEKAYDL